MELKIKRAQHTAVAAVSNSNPPTLVADWHNGEAFSFAPKLRAFLPNWASSGLGSG